MPHDSKTGEQTSLDVSSSEIVRKFQPDGTLTFVNEACCRFYKKTSEEIVGRNLASFLSADDQNEIIAAIFSMTPEHPEVVTRPQYINADGKVRYVKYTNRGIFRADGTIIGYESTGKEVVDENPSDAPTSIPTDIGKTSSRTRVHANAFLQEKNIGIFSEEMFEIICHAEKYHTDRSIPVLIEGETGVGKEIIARIIHFGQGNSLLPFVDINCTAISSSLFESELFGYESGAFTGAVNCGKRGKLDCARRGTLFLDEVAEIPVELQAKLLRVLEEKHFYRVGGLHSISTDIRIIAASNLDIDKNVGAGTFRQDLYYRLKVGHIRIPPLRERRNDILPLAQMLLRLASKKRNKGFRNISSAACELLLNHPWPGNIRELKNLMEWATFMYDAPLLLAEHIQHRLTIPGGDSLLTSSSSKKKILVKKNITAIDIHNTINRCGGNKTRAARELGISLRTLYNRLEHQKQDI
ncbi:MAG: sigma 54-interacting transcriptional regulator [Desulfoplanes sp.]